MATIPPIATAGERQLRMGCSFHGSDHSRSLTVNLDGGRFGCYQCGAWGYLSDGASRQLAIGQANSSGRPGPRPRRAPKPPAPVRRDLDELLARYQAALPG